MPQRVRRHRAPHPRAPARSLDHHPERLPRQWTAVAVDEERPRIAPLHEGGARGRCVPLYPLERLRPHGHEPLTVALTGRGDVARRDVEILEPERQALGSAQAGRVEELQHGAIPQPLRRGQIGRLDESGRVLDGEGAGQPARGPWRLEMLGRIAPDLAGGEEEAIEATHGREMPCCAAGAEPTPAQLGQVLAEIADPHRSHGTSTASEERGESREVSSVGREGVGGGAPLRLQGGEELAESVHQSLRGLNTATPRWRPFHPAEAVTGAYPTYRRSMTKSITRSLLPARSAGHAPCRRVRGAPARARRRPPPRTRARRRRARPSCTGRLPSPRPAGRA